MPCANFPAWHQTSSNYTWWLPTKAQGNHHFSSPASTNHGCLTTDDKRLNDINVVLRCCNYGNYGVFVAFLSQSSLVAYRHCSFTMVSELLPGQKKMRLKRDFNSKSVSCSTWTAEIDKTPLRQLSIANWVPQCSPFHAGKKGKSAAVHVHLQPPWCWQCLQLESEHHPETCRMNLTTQHWICSAGMRRLGAVVSVQLYRTVGVPSQDLH